MKTHDLVRAGLIAAHELSVPKDAKIDFIAEGIVHSLNVKLRDVSEIEAEYAIEHVRLRFYRDREFGVWLGYSRRANTLILRPSGEPLVKDCPHCGHAYHIESGCDVCRLTTGRADLPHSMRGKRWVTRP